MSPSATSPALTELEPAASDETPGLLWRTVPPDSLQGRVIVSFGNQHLDPPARDEACDLPRVSGCRQDAQAVQRELAAAEVEPMLTGRASLDWKLHAQGNTSGAITSIDT